jgi:leukotriene-A4 hydrolase
MTLRVGLLVLCGLMAVAGCRSREEAEPETVMTIDDVHSFARAAEARVTHVALDLRVDFESRTLRGTAALQIARAPGATTLVLDTSDLRIAAVRDQAGHALPYNLGEPDPLLGQALTITLGGASDVVTVEYATTPRAAALQWLTPAQTAGKRHPYLYSQGQAILTRSWIPTQDTPAIRQTFDARITVPAPLVAVMGAEAMTPQGRPASGGLRTFEFQMRDAIPPYLFALAVGDIAFAEIGPRTGVYAEPSVVAGAAREFSDLEAMITAAETIGGPYRWGRYDVLVLPPSFPYGGMENPRVTFATPTILAGDKSLVSLIAHELAHSWSGNLVTNATWGDFWLNEGFTSYFENRIMEALYGGERAAMLARLAHNGLLQELETLPPADTVLALNLEGRNPDDSVNAIAYDKGAALLFTIEHAVGRERFDPYLRGYFNRHAFTPMTTALFVEDLRDNLIQHDARLEASLQLDAWLHEPGLPSNAYVPQSAAFERVEAQAEAFVGGTAAASLSVKAWTPQEWQHFLETLRAQTLTPAQLRDLDSTFALSTSGNSELLFAWLRIAIANRHAPAMPALERFLTEQGRRKFLRPLYEDLMKQEWGQAEARRIYVQARPGYHSVATGTIDEIVK